KFSMLFQGAAHQNSICPIEAGISGRQYIIGCMLLIMQALDQSHACAIQNIANAELSQSVSIRSGMPGRRPQFTSVAQEDMDDLMRDWDSRTSRLQDDRHHTFARIIHRP